MQAAIRSNLIGHLPCSEGCQPCVQFIRTFQQDVGIVGFWNLLMYFGEERSCAAARKVRNATKGSLISIQGLCPNCVSDEVDLNNSFEQLEVSAIQGLVDTDEFVFLARQEGTESLCPHHARPLVTIQCFGDILQFCVLRTTEPIDENMERRRSNVVPLRVSLGAERISMCIDAEETFLGRSLYVANPCYSSSWLDSRATIISQERVGTELFVFAKMRETSWDNGLWDLADVSEGKPYRNSSGAFKILDSMISSLGRLDFDTVALFPPVTSKQSSSVHPILPSNDIVLNVLGDGNRRDVTDESREGLVPVPSDRTPAQNGKQAGVPNSNDDMSRSESIAVAVRPIVEDIGSGGDLRHVEKNRDVLGGYETTSIPLLYASYPFLWEAGVQNGHYRPDDAVNSSSLCMQGLLDEIQGGRDLLESGTALNQFKRLVYHKDALLSEAAEPLRLNCDLDSVDILTIPWGGMSFQGPMSKILSQYQARYAENDAYLGKNNNLAQFSDGLPMRFPGRYFSEKSFSKIGRRANEEPSLAEPLAVRLFDMNTSLSIQALRVRAMIPTGSINFALIGQSSLLVLFNSFVTGRPRESCSSGDCRATLQRMFWYLLREFLMLMASMITSNACYPVTNSMMPCCAVPMKQNCHKHDRKRGTDSSFDEGVCLEKDELALTFYLSARFFASLEQHAELSSQSSTFSRSENSLYNCPDELLGTVEDLKVRECLTAELGDPICLQFFKENVWNERSFAGGLVTLSSDETRKGTGALPSFESNRTALQSGQMVLEDLLLLAPTIFRCTAHGMKRNLSSSRNALLVKTQLEKELDLERVRDGIVDLAFTLQGPRNAGWAVTLPTSTARESKLLVPVNRSYLTFRQLNASLYSTSGYPECIGFSTKKGHAGEPDTVLCADGVRRVKVYSSKHRNEATRGWTVHDATGSQLQASFRDFSKVMCNWTNLRGTAGSSARKTSEKEEEARRNMFEVLLHDIERRKKAALASEDGFGLRVELTCACKCDWSSIEDVVHLMRIQELRRGMSREEFETSFRQDPEKWPWWLNVPSSSLRNRQRTPETYELSCSLLPVTIFSCETFVKLGFAIEQKLVENSHALYLQALCNVSGNSLMLPERSIQIYSTLCHVLSHGGAVRFALILIRALVKAASIFLGSITCNFQDLSFQMSPFILSACGLDCSWVFSGFPQVVLARILSVDRQFARALSKTPTGQCDVIDELLATGQEMEYIATSLELDMNTPLSLAFTERKGKRGFLVSVLGGQAEASYAHTSDSKGAIHDVLESLYQGQDSPAGGKTVLQDIAAMIAVLVVSDCCKELDVMLRFSPPWNADERVVEQHKNRMNPKMSAAMPRALARLTCEGLQWPVQFTLDSCTLNLETEEERSLNQRMGGLLSFYGRDANGQSCLDEEHVSFRNSLTDDDGCMRMNKFIQTLWSQVGLLKHFSDLVPEIGKSSGAPSARTRGHKWRSIIALRIVEGLVDLESERCRKSNLCIGDGGPLPKVLFVEHFPGMLAQSFVSAGLLNLCPLLAECMPRKNEEDVRIWGPLPVFTLLKYENEVLGDLCRETGKTENESAAAQGRRRGLREQRTVSLLQFLRTISSSLSQINMELRSAIQQGSRQAIQNCLAKKKEISRSLWSENRILDLLLECLQRKSETTIDGSSPNAVTVEFAERVLQFSIEVRRQAIDEGIAAYEWNEPNSSRIQISGIGDRTTSRQRRKILSTFESDLDIFKKPWKKVWVTPALQ